MAENSFRLRYEAKKSIRRLGSLSRHRRENALSRLREFGPNGIEAVHDAIDHEKTEWQHQQTRLSCMLLVLVVPAVLALWSMFQQWKNLSQDAVFTSAFVVLASLITAGVLSLRRPASGYHRQMIALAEIGDLSSIVRLIEALDIGDLQARDQAAEAVAGLLTSINTENAWLIGWQSRETLYRHLNGNHVPLVVAILKTLPILRDDAALPMLEKLAASERPAATDPEVRAALQGVLPLIREIAAHKTGKQTLLRSSEANHVAAGTALRPASGTDKSFAGELLRPNNVEA